METAFTIVRGLSNLGMGENIGWKVIVWPQHAQWQNGEQDSVSWLCLLWSLEVNSVLVSFTLQSSLSPQGAIERSKMYKLNIDQKNFTGVKVAISFWNW